MCDIDAAPKVPDTRRPKKTQNERQQQRVPGMCIKCKTARPNVTIRRCLYCKPCFVRTSVVKFRAALSKSRRRIEDNKAAGARSDTEAEAAEGASRAMVALSGGACSSALLQLTLDYHKSMAEKGAAVQSPYSQIIVGHVDESALFDVASDAVRGIAGDVEFRQARLEDVFAATDDSDALLQIVAANIAPGSSADRFKALVVRPASEEQHSPRERLHRLFDSLGSATNRESLLDAIKTYLLARLARESGCSVLLMGDSATRIASKIVSLTSRGRGFSLPLEVASECAWLDGLTVVRPMRDFVAKEIAFLNLWAGFRSVVVPTFTTGAPAHASIDRLTEAFVVGLDRDFASTVPTVCRTVQKLEPRPEALVASPCLVCGMPVDPNSQTWRSRLTVSDAPLHSSASEPASIPADADISTSASSAAAPPLDISTRLCYACQSVLHFCKSDGLVLPAFCAERLADQADTSASSGTRGHEALRKQVEQFLIDSDDEHDDCGR
ncbi:Cytoplasmic tRNA 2-thiolation protein 2 [Coemansia sp. IMI 203386]|nr:Cytoplasmic tRNA 2-thiolation protein 2 [Coemansia sp. IMI 203386]